MARMHRNQSVDVNRFAMVPRAEIPRSSFVMERSYKTTFDGGYLVPVFCEEVLPGDTFNVSMTAFCRLATPIFPFMDNLHLDSFFFFVPNRLTWLKWRKFMGEQDAPGDSIAFTIPQIVSPAGGFAIGSLYDYFGLPTVGQVAGGATVSINALPLRGYNLIYNEWFRDENLIPSLFVNQASDGPDNNAQYTLQRRGKRKDYFTGALPWPQKGGVAVSLPLTGNAVVKTSATDLFTGAQEATRLLRTTGAELGQTQYLGVGPAAGDQNQRLWTSLTPAGASFTAESAYFSNLYADLSTVTSTTINALRQSFQIQKLLERDARGGTRYTEIVRAHFGVVSPDARLQRPEYLGGGSSPIVIVPVPQTSNTAAPPTPLGTLSATGTALARHGFSQSFTEHGYIIGVVSARADLTYQQGLRRHWSRSTRYDYYFPAFAMLGEQTILNKEIWVRGDANDNLVFGYQERWAEMRYLPSEITGLFRSTAAGTLDPWHLSINFTSLPALNATFIADDPPIDRVIAVPAQPHFLADMFFSVRAARPLPLYSVPGLIDHF